MVLTNYLLKQILFTLQSNNLLDEISLKYPVKVLKNVTFHINTISSYLKLSSKSITRYLSFPFSVRKDKNPSFFNFYSFNITKTIFCFFENNRNFVFLCLQTS